MNIQSFIRIIEKCKESEVISSADFNGMKEYTGEAFAALVCSFAHKYYNEIGKGKRIALLGEADCNYLIHLFAVMASGNIAIPINPSFSIEQVMNALETIEADKIIMDEDLLSDYEAIRIDKSAFATEASDYVDFDVNIDDSMVNLMIMSSGTTGKSKAVMLNGKNLFEPVQYYLNMNIKEPSCKTLMTLPLHHIGGIYLPLEMLVKGNSVHISNAKRLLSDIKNYEFQKIITVPSMAEKIIKNYDKSDKVKKQLSGLKEILCVGAAERPELPELLKERNIEYKTYYGMTEAAGPIAGAGSYRAGAVGKIFPFCEVRLVENEICVKGNNISEGYYNAPDETKVTFVGDWLYTGDIGRFDEDGYLYITGRKKNIIILSNGENVSPEELENKLYGCIYIKECMVYGQDENICVDIFVEDIDKKNEVDSYIKELNKKLPLSQKLHTINYCECELEKNSTGKIVRR